MDINEVTGKKINRHPWELSRTQCLMTEWMPYIDKLGDECEFIDIGAGDMYFDKHVLHVKKGHKLHAVDLGYDTEKREYVKSDSRRICMYKELSDLPVELIADYALMLDSIEYMPDEAGYIRDLSKHIKPGGYLFLAMPAYQFLFSRHDVIVKLLRRYNRREFRDIVSEAGGLRIIRSRYFYSSLFMVRFLQKFLKMDIDPDEKVTTGWKYGEKHIVTRMVKGFLDFDFTFGMLMAKLGIMLPGLSLMVICRKDENNDTDQ